MPNAVEECDHSGKASPEKPGDARMKGASSKNGIYQASRHCDISAVGGWKQFVKAPSIFHSAMYGMVAGVVFYGGYFAWRAYKLSYCNTEYYARQSRWRHFEKQQLYQRELGEKMNTHFVASLAQEYDPVALRKPNSTLDQKYIF